MSDFMEDNLSMPLGSALPIIQDSIVHKTTYFGIQTLKNPFDAWIYQEIIYETRPDYIVEIGNFGGGSALMLAHICDLMGKGLVIGLDLSHAAVPEVVSDHRRVTLVEGDAYRNFEKVRAIVKATARVLVIEDSSHTFENTLNVLRRYSTLLTVGDYFIVEDSICHHGLEVGPKPGPYEAIEAFLNENKAFESDRNRERFLITWNPKGYLRRIAR